MDSFPEKAGEFLAGRRNLVGLAAFLLVLLALLGLSESPWAAVIAAILGYAAGYVLTPPARPAAYASGVPRAGATAEQMEARIQDLRETVRRQRDRMPPDSHPVLEGLFSGLQDVTGRWQDVSRAPEQRLVLEQVVHQYLPDTLEAFLQLPDSAKPAAAAEWTQQLRILRTEVDRSRDTVLRHDLEAMRTNGRLLEQRFEDGDLRRFRELGL